ncbi:MAG: serine protease [Gammaproteobacteria bacterium]|nr:serine protease [Gammaproteobacteria bacterium]
MKAKPSQTFSLQVRDARDAVVGISTRVPDEAVTSDMLGTLRSGHGIVIRDDGLIVTIGYLVVDAESAWIRTAAGQVVPGYVVCYDHESGLGLVRSCEPLAVAPAAIGASAALPVGAEAWFCSSGDGHVAQATQVVSRHEFVGRWEYLLEEALFTAPPHGNWAGAALLDQAGRLCAVGSLLLQIPNTRGKKDTVNMFVPIEAILPHLDSLIGTGTRATPARPWIGALIQDDDEQLMVAGVHRDSPADAAGLAPGDFIVSIDGHPVTDLTTFYRAMWRLGPAGCEIPLTILTEEETREVRVKSADRNLFHWRGAMKEALQ